MGNLQKNEKWFAGYNSLDELAQEQNNDSMLTCYDFFYKGKHYQMVQDMLLDYHRQIRVFWFPENKEGLGLDENGNAIENDLQIFDTEDHKVALESYILHDGVPLIEALQAPGLIEFD